MGEYVTNSLLGALEIVVHTDPGLVRGQNEDSVFGDASQGLAILADGMGGYNAGEVASSMATTLLASATGRGLQGHRSARTRH
jgi:serine/threonine protein phosphatase PrpC